jgi:hypothetical protein
MPPTQKESSPSRAISHASLRDGRRTPLVVTPKPVQGLPSARRVRACWPGCFVYTWFVCIVETGDWTSWEPIALSARADLAAFSRG